MRWTRLACGAAVWLALATSGWAAEPGSFDLAAYGLGKGPAAIEGNNGYLGIFADAQATSSCATIPAGNVGTLYLFGFMDGATAPGLYLAEFRVEVTHPDGYQFFYLPPAGAITIGNLFDLTPSDPFDPSGLDVVLAACRDQAPVPFGTIMVVNQSGGPTELLVKRKNGPSNPASNCPVVISCEPPMFPAYCMTPCAFDATGGAIASRASLNDPACSEGRECPATCVPERCVTLSASASRPACGGQPLTITATAVNCSKVDEDIDVFVAYGLAGSFTGVAPGQSVTASRTYVMPGCEIGLNDRPPVGAVVRTAGCSQPFGREIAVPLFCGPCGPNQPPDCSAARATVPVLWPPDGRLVEESVTGITDPDGDPLHVSILLVSSDEPTGTDGTPSCPDAFMDAPLAVRLRAERLPDRDGRIYMMTVKAQDPAGAECRADVQVCVPSKPGVECNGYGFDYPPAICDPMTRPASRGVPLRTTPVIGGGVEVRFTAAVEFEGTLEVFDIRGRRVASVAHSRFAAGEHVLSWDGRDAGGSAVATGIYLFRLNAGGSVETAKTLVVR